MFTPLLQQGCLNVGDNTPFTDSHIPAQLGQLSVTPDGQLNVTGGDTMFLEVLCCSAGQLKYLR